MLKRSDLAWDTPVTIEVLPSSIARTWHLAGEHLVIPLGPGGALALLLATGEERLITGDEAGCIVPDVVSLAFDAGAAAAARPTARHLAGGEHRPRHQGTETADGTGAGDGTGAVAQPGDIDVVGPSDVEDHDAAAGDAVEGEGDDRTVTGADLHRMLSEREREPQTVDENTVLGTASTLGLATPPRASTPSDIPGPMPTQLPDPMPTQPSAAMEPPTPSGTMFAPVQSPAQPGAVLPPTPGGVFPMPESAAKPEPTSAAPGTRQASGGQRPPMIRVEDDAGVNEVPVDARLVFGLDPSRDSVRDHDVRLVPVRAAGGDVSRSHACVRLQGGVVLVCDLWSTNGTRIKTPGQAPFRLRDGEEMPVSVGTVIELGDGVKLSVLGGRHGA